MLSVKSSVMLSVTFLADFESPSRRRPSQPFFSIAVSVSTSAPVRNSGTSPGGSLDGGAGAGTAGERQAGAALPDAQLHRGRSDNLGDADIGALGEERVVLEPRPQLRERDGVEIVDEESGVRIAHAGAGRILQRTGA